MKCSKCKYEFCWLCLEPWKKHSGSTGGYFQCNRYEATNKAQTSRKLSILEAEEAHQKAAESNKFAHYYTRFKNHEHSLKLEEGLLLLLLSRRSSESGVVVMLDRIDEVNVVDANKSGVGVSEEAIRELLHARRVLRCSYAYGFFLGS